MGGMDAAALHREVGRTKAVWLLTPDDADLPAEWRERGTPMTLVPLTPDELRRAAGATGDPGTEFLRLVARGLPAYEIAKTARLTSRTVYRRLAHLRERFGVATNAELCAELARRGF